MKICDSKYSLTPYKYKRYNVNEIDVNLIKILYKRCKTISVGKGRYAKTYIHLYSGFDIETYTTDSNNAYMYVWQWSLWDGNAQPIVIIGRTWNDFMQLIEILGRAFELKNNKRMLVWIANIGYEWSYIRKRINVTEYFFKDERTPLKFTHNDIIDFQDCLTISGGSLAYLAKTYTNTQKARGDLDYSIPRNRYTHLTDEELIYCDNDVLILAEWSKYYFNEYFLGGCGYIYQPLTMQATLRKRMKDKAEKWFESQGKNGKNVYLAISSCYPHEKTYKYLMRWCFRGGYTHGNVLYVGDKMDYRDNIVSYDLTSSYPSVMEHNYFPNRLYHKNNVNYDEYLNLIKKYCVIADMTFYDLKPTTQHSIESKNKCIKLVDSIIDNGRVFRAKEMRVCITEVDYRIYSKFYSWSKVEIHSALIANRMRLPDYVLHPMEQDYNNKARLKMEHKPYNVEKSRVNSYYGVMVTRLNEQEIALDDDSETGLSPKAGKSYYEQIKKSVLLPQWGIYITAWARYNILSVARQCASDCLYIDTDSIKIRNGWKYQDIIYQYNKRIENQNKKMCKERGLDYTIFHDLGMLDCEIPKVWYLKYLGAKRYLYTKFDYGQKRLVDVQTIAGLPKDTLPKMFKNDRNGLYDFFNDEMIVDMSGKLYTYYNDNETSEYITDNQGNTALCTELSNTALVPCTFKMSLDKMWYDWFMTYRDSLKWREKR